MPFTFSGQSWDSSWPGAVRGQHKNPSQVALQNPEINEIINQNVVASLSWTPMLDQTRQILKMLSKVFCEHSIKWRINKQEC